MRMITPSVGPFRLPDAGDRPTGPIAGNDPHFADASGTGEEGRWRSFLDEFISQFASPRSADATALPRPAMSTSLDGDDPDDAAGAVRDMLSEFVPQPWLDAGLDPETLDADALRAVFETLRAQRASAEESDPVLREALAMLVGTGLGSSSGPGIDGPVSSPPDEAVALSAGEASNIPRSAPRDSDRDITTLMRAEVERGEAAATLPVPGREIRGQSATDPVAGSMAHRQPGQAPDAPLPRDMAGALADANREAALDRQGTAEPAMQGDRPDRPETRVGQDPMAARSGSGSEDLSVRESTSFETGSRPGISAPGTSGAPEGRPRQMSPLADKGVGAPAAGAGPGEGRPAGATGARDQPAFTTAAPADNSRQGIATGEAVGAEPVAPLRDQTTATRPSEATAAALARSADPARPPAAVDARAALSQVTGGSPQISGEARHEADMAAGGPVNLTGTAEPYPFANRTARNSAATAADPDAARQIGDGPSLQQVAPRPDDGSDRFEVRGDRSSSVTEPAPASPRNAADAPSSPRHAHPGTPPNQAGGLTGIVAPVSQQRASVGLFSGEQASADAPAQGDDRQSTAGGADSPLVAELRANRQGQGPGWVSAAATRQAPPSDSAPDRPDGSPLAADRSAAPSDRAAAARLASPATDLATEGSENAPAKHLSRQTAPASTTASVIQSDALGHLQAASPAGSPVGGDAAEMLADIRGGSDPAAPLRAGAPHGLAASHGEAAVRVSRQIASAMQNAGERSFDISLSPAELGKVRIGLLPSEAGISVSILADRPETLDLLRRHADILAQEFRDIGYRSVDFSFASGDQPGHRFGDGAHENGPDIGLSEASEESLPSLPDAQQPAPRAARDASGRMDIRI